MASRTCRSSLIERFFEYDTPQMLHTNSKLVGIMFRLLQLVIFTFIFGYYIGLKKGYQDVSNTVAISTRVSLQEPKTTSMQYWSFPIYWTLKDTDKIYIPTFAIQHTQLESVCPEDIDVIGAVCDPYFNRCKPNITLPNGNGLTTGDCVSSRNSMFTMKLNSEKEYYGCEIKGWCTTNKEYISVAEMMNVKEMSLIIENEIYFPKFPDERKLSNYNQSIIPCIKNDRFYSTENPLCPVFKIGDVLKKGATVNGKLLYTYPELVQTGAIFLIHITWDCNFDIREPFKDCSIKYDVKRMDTNLDIGSKTPDNKFGINVYQTRQIIHIYGIRFLTMVEGSARKFNLITLIMRLGASAGLFAIASLVCEFLIILSCCTRERQVRYFKFINMKNQLMQPKDGNTEL